MAPFTVADGPLIAGWGAFAAVPDGPVVLLDAQPTASARAPAASQGMIRMCGPPGLTRPCKLRTGPGRASPGCGPLPLCNIDLRPTATRPGPVRRRCRPAGPSAVSPTSPSPAPAG